MLEYHTFTGDYGIAIRNLMFKENKSHLQR
jgi:hypothetical protein